MPPGEKTTIRVNWTVVPGGTLEDILSRFRKQVDQAEVDTTYVVHAFHNSIAHITADYAAEMIGHHEQAMADFNQRNKTNHRLVWAEADYPPRNERFFPLIDRVNVLLRCANEKAGFPPCRPWRVTSPPPDAGCYYSIKRRVHSQNM